MTIGRWNNRKPLCSFNIYGCLFLTVCIIVGIIFDWITGNEWSKSIQFPVKLIHERKQLHQPETWISPKYTTNKANTTTTPYKRAELVKPHASTTVREPKRQKTEDKTTMTTMIQIPLSCAENNRTSEVLSMKPFQFLHNYKNPCWYEPLVKSDVYSTNKIKSVSNHSGMLAEEWKKRLKEESGPKTHRCLPYFFIAGLPKCGTTDIYDKLTSHPDIAKTVSKEHHWWTRRRANVNVPFQRYLNAFHPAARLIEKGDNSTAPGKQGYHHMITGDGSPSTLWFNDYWAAVGENCGVREPRFTTAHYIYHLLPEAKFIVTFRNPTERLYSDYLHFAQNKSADNFHKRVLLEKDCLERCLQMSSLRACVYNITVLPTKRASLRIGIYFVYLQDFFKVFPKDQFYIIRMEDWTKNRLTILQDLHRFLGLRALTPKEQERLITSNISNKKTTKSEESGPMRQDTRELLNKFYHPYNTKLASLLNGTKYLWSASSMK